MPHTHLINPLLLQTYLPNRLLCSISPAHQPTIQPACLPSSLPASLPTYLLWATLLPSFPPNLLSSCLPIHLLESRPTTYDNQPKLHHPVRRLNLSPTTLVIESRAKLGKPFVPSEIFICTMPCLFLSCASHLPLSDPKCVACASGPFPSVIIWVHIHRTNDHHRIEIP